MPKIEITLSQDEVKEAVAFYLNDQLQIDISAQDVTFYHRWEAGSDLEETMEVVAAANQE